MKKLELKVTIEVTDSTNVADIVSDMEDGLLCDNVKKTTIETEGKTYEFENEDFEEQKLLVRNKWNRRIYKIISETDSEVTLEREDGTQFTISRKDFYLAYVKSA